MLDGVRDGRLSQSVRRLGFNASGVLNAPSTSCISDYSAFRLSAVSIGRFELCISSRPITGRRERERKIEGRRTGKPDRGTGYSA